MDAKTVQKQRQQALDNGELLDGCLTFFHRNIVHELIIPGKRSATDVYRLLQAVKDSPSKVDDFLKVLDGTHVVVATDTLFPALDPVTGFCRFVVDFGKSLSKMVADGHYDLRGDNITSTRFPISGSGRVSVDAKVFHFNCQMTSHEVARELDRAGYRSATIEELLAFGARFPEVQRRFPVLALGSFTRVSNLPYIPCLDTHDAKRGIHLYWSDGEWDHACRFLAVRKVA